MDYALAVGNSQLTYSFRNGGGPGPHRRIHTAQRTRSTLKTHNLAIIHGDGIGPEVNQQAIKALQAAAERFGFGLETTEYPLGAQNYIDTGKLVDIETLDRIRRHDAILFGAMGDPRVSPGILERVGKVLILLFPVARGGGRASVRGAWP